MGSTPARSKWVIPAILTVVAAACTGPAAPDRQTARNTTAAARPSVPPGSASPGPTDVGASSSGVATPEPVGTTGSGTTPATDHDRRMLVVWIRGELPPSTVAAIAAVPGVAAVAPVSEGTMWLDGPTDDGPGDTRAVPLDAAAAAPGDLRAVLGERPWLRPLADGEAVLSATSEALRGGAPERLRFGRVGIPVGAVASDRDVGAHEVFLSSDVGGRFGLGGADYLLVRIADDAAARATEAAVRRVAGGTVAVAVRVRSQAETAYLRQGDGVMPPEWTKVFFGEFSAVRSGDAIEIDPAWVDRHIATERVPILGEVTCNRAFIPPLRATLHAVQDAGLRDLVDPAHYGGCFAARLIRGSTSQLSQHAYGAAIDVNVAGNLLGATPTQDPRLVKAFADEGFVWGGDFLLPDGMHFEYGCPATMALPEQTDVPEQLAGLALCRGA